MKIQVLSDLHLEFFNIKQQKNVFIDSLLPKEEVDVLVLAGDISTKTEIVEDLKQFCGQWKNVIYVTGNHEYYKSGFKYIHDQIYNIHDSNLFFLNNDDVLVDGQRFIGTTLWFPDVDGHNFIYKHMLNDFCQILNLQQDVYKINQNSVDCLNEHVRIGDVVITHHLPANGSIAERFKNDSFSRFFLCNMEDLIKREKPKLWIHGHTHDSFDYQLEDTRIVCNPYGYFGHEENKSFQDHMVIEL